MAQRTQPPPPPSATQQQQHRTSYVKQLFPPAEDTASTAAGDGDTAPEKSSGRCPPQEEEDKAVNDASEHEEMEETPMTEPLLPRRSSPPEPAKQSSTTKTGQGDSVAEVEAAVAPAPAVAALPRNPYAKPANKASAEDTAPKPTSAGGADRGRDKSNTRSTGGSGEKRKRSSSPHVGDPTHRAAGAAKGPSGLRSYLASAVAAAVPQGLARQPQPKKRKGRDGSAGTAGRRGEKENRENRTTKKLAGTRGDIPIPSFSSSPRPSSSARKGADTTKARGDKRTSDNMIVIDSDEESSGNASGAKNQMAPPPPRRRTMSPPVPVRTVEIASRGSKTTVGKYPAQSASDSVPYSRIPRNRRGKGGKVSSDDSEEPGYKYKEVVRDRDKRRAMKGFECDQCREFYEALAKGGEDFNREEMVCKHSRHRSNHAPDLTPDGFWELSFADSQKSPSQHWNARAKDEDV